MGKKNKSTFLDTQSDSRLAFPIAVSYNRVAFLYLNILDFFFFGWSSDHVFPIPFTISCFMSRSRMITSELALVSPNPRIQRQEQQENRKKKLWRLNIWINKKSYEFFGYFR